MGMVAIICAILLVILIPNEILHKIIWLGLIGIIAVVGFYALVGYIAGI